MMPRVFIVLAAGVLAGCSGGGATTAQPTNCPAVTGVFDANARLISPAPGSTSIATNVGSLSFTVSIAALRGGTVLLSPTTGSTGTVVGGPITTDTNGVSSAPIPLLQSNTTYDARIHANPVDPTTGCHGAADGDLGSFTTR